MDYYDILGVRPTASQAEIKRAFRRRARELHPDVNPSPDATERFRELNTAYQVLSDPLLRRRYDNFGAAPPGRPSAGPYQPPEPPDYPAPPSGWGRPPQTARRYATFEREMANLSPMGRLSVIGSIVLIILFLHIVVFYSIGTDYHSGWFLQAGNVIGLSLICVFSEVIPCTLLILTVRGLMRLWKLIAPENRPGR